MLCSGVWGKKLSKSNPDRRTKLVEVEDLEPERDRLSWEILWFSPIGTKNTPSLSHEQDRINSKLVA